MQVSNRETCLVEDFCTDSDPMLSGDVNTPRAAFGFMKHKRIELVKVMANAKNGSINYKNQ